MNMILFSISNMPPATNTHTQQQEKTNKKMHCVIAPCHKHPDKEMKNIAMFCDMK